MTLRLPTGYAASCVPTQMTEEAWQAVRHLVAEALEYCNGYTPEDVYARIAAGHSQLWVVEKDMTIVGCVVTEVFSYPRCRSLNIWLLCGIDLQQWKPCIAQLEIFARSERCDFIEATGRPGLMKFAKDLGFTSPRVALTKKIDYTTH